MAMLIKGDEINALVAKYCAMTGQTNKSEAVRQAIFAQISAMSSAEPLADRVSKLRARAAEQGFVSAGSDKAFMDELWGED